jgi:hypothetical protein
MPPNWSMAMALRVPFVDLLMMKILTYGWRLIGAF